MTSSPGDYNLRREMPPKPKVSWRAQPGATANQRATFSILIFNAARDVDSIQESTEWLPDLLPLSLRVYANTCRRGGFRGGYSIEDASSRALSPESIAKSAKPRAEVPSAHDLEKSKQSCCIQDCQAFLQRLRSANRKTVIEPTLFRYPKANMLSPTLSKRRRIAHALISLSHLEALSPFGSRVSPHSTSCICPVMIRVNWNGF